MYVVLNSPRLKMPSGGFSRSRRFVLPTNKTWVPFPPQALSSISFNPISIFLNSHETPCSSGGPPRIYQKTKIPSLTIADPRATTSCCSIFHTPQTRSIRHCPDTNAEEFVSISHEHPASDDLFSHYPEQGDGEVMVIQTP